MKTTLGVNIDHIATLREARKITEPDPLYGMVLSELAGCHCITAHLREDRRHMHDRDIYAIRQHIKTKFNLEISCAEEIIEIALDVCPHQVTVVPERRQEITTEGGLQVVGREGQLSLIIQRFHKKNMIVSLFIDPDIPHIDAAKACGADSIELHTGNYANTSDEASQTHELQTLKDATEYALSLGLRVNAGHGLNYRNVSAVSAIDGIEELNIGHAIISHAVFVGLSQAVKEMLALL